MNSGNSSMLIQQLYDHAADKGLCSECLFGKENLNSYADTAVDAYRNYVLFSHVFKGDYDPKEFGRVISVDLRSRLGFTAGIASSKEYESIMLIEPPLSRKTGMISYFGVARPEDYTLLLHPIIYRLESYEKFTLDKRKSWLDDKTWYMYIFATKESFKGMGYGKKLMNYILSYVGEKGYRICLETNDPDNVGMYEHFGFTTVDQSMYQNAIEHYIMLFNP